VGPSCFKEACKTNLGNYLASDPAAEELRQSFHSVVKAWQQALPSSEVRAHWPGISWDVQLDFDASLASLLPRPRLSRLGRPASIIDAFLECLVDAQNDLLQMLWHQNQDWRCSGEALQLDAVVPADLIVPKDGHIEPLLAASYGALELDKYDLEGLEQHVLYSFIHGRRLLGSSTLCNSWPREEGARPQQREEMRKAIPQEPLPGAVQLLALSDADLASAQRAVEVALGLLAASPTFERGRQLVELLQS
jgi:hypothetical protein